MTVKEILTRALSLIIEGPEDNPDFTEHAVHHINLILPELFFVNNIAREKNDKDKLQQYQVVKTIDDECDIEYQLNTAIVFGLAASLLAADENMEQASIYQQKYYAAVANAFQVESMKVVDIYAEN